MRIQCEQQHERLRDVPAETFTLSTESHRLHRLPELTQTSAYTGFLGG